MEGWGYRIGITLGMSSETGQSGSLGKRHGFGSKDAARCDDECSALRVHVQRAACAYAPH